MVFFQQIPHFPLNTYETQLKSLLKNWSRRIMETFSQFAIVTPFNQRRPLCQVSLFLRYQKITHHKDAKKMKTKKVFLATNGHEFTQISVTISVCVFELHSLI